MLTAPAHDLLHIIFKNTLLLTLYAVEILTINIEINSFSSLTNRHETLNPTPLLTLLKILQQSGVCEGAYISTARRTQRVAVILRSPFHYKLPKHHLKYTIFTHRLFFRTHSLHTINALKFLLNDTPYRVRITRKVVLKSFGCI